jgi:phage/plasmid-like protein (TIGR03299 family)
MAHEITSSDGLFTVREPAWHGLGTVLADYPTRAEAQPLVHGWEPVQEPLYRKRVEIHPTLDGSDVEPVEVFEEVDEARLNVRNDTLEGIGVVSSTYTPIDNSTLWDIAEALQGDGGAVRYETGGTLKGGRKVWLLLRLNEPLLVPGRDPNSASIAYYALQNSHDSSGSFRGQATMTRIVCDNTSQIADMDAQARGTEFVFQHTSRVAERIEEARAALAGWRTSITAWNQFSEVMSGVHVTAEDVADFVTAFIPEPPGQLVSERVRANIKKAREEWWTIFNGPTCEGVNSVSLGLVHASVEYSQHYRKTKDGESGFKRAYLDRSTLTQQAVKIAREIARV